MGDWEEIKRLAADFQRAQLSSTVQKLSERNCIEIVQCLLQQKLIDVIYTTDGKEYLTPDELGKEILEEIQVQGGRINLTELQKILNVDLHHIEKKASDIVGQEENIFLILGQLIDQSYLDAIAEEVNDKLQESGQVKIADLTVAYDLPGEFISQALLSRIGTIIQGEVDEYNKNTIFTRDYVDKHKAIIRGALSAVTRPLPLINLIHQLGIQDRLFHNIADELVSLKRLRGNISGGRQEKAVYVPDIYTEAQNQWIDSFLKQNGYLEYDSVSRLGIADPQGFLKKRFKGQSLMFLNSCCVGSLIIDHIQAEIDEALSTTGWIDISPFLPTVFGKSDAAQILSKCVKSKSGVTVCCDSIVVGEGFISSCGKSFDQLIRKKAENDARANPGLLTASAKVDESTNREDKKDQRRKKAAAGGKSGGGTQGREGKTKSTKKKGGRRDRGDSDSEDEAVQAPSSKQGNNKMVELEFMSSEEIVEKLSKMENIKECPEELKEEIASQLYRPLRRQYQEVLQSVFLQTIGSGSSQARKRTHGELQEKLSGLWVNAKQFEKAVKAFPDDTQAYLYKHLLKTVCTDMANLAFNTLATEHMMSMGEESEVTQELRLKVINKITDDKLKALLTKFNSSLNGKTTEEFFDCFEQASGSALEIMLKKPDKKKERQVHFNYRQSIAGQLKDELDPAMSLHLAVVLMVQVLMGHMLHAPGRCVPAIVTFLQPHVTPENHQQLLHYQDLVVQSVKAQSKESENTSEIQRELEELLPKIKDIALNARKLGSQNQQQEEE